MRLQKILILPSSTPYHKNACPNHERNPFGQHLCSSSQWQQHHRWGQRERQHPPLRRSQQTIEPKTRAFTLQRQDTMLRLVSSWSTSSTWLQLLITLPAGYNLVPSRVCWISTLSASERLHQLLESYIHSAVSSSVRCKPYFLHRSIL